MRETGMIFKLSNAFDGAVYVIECIPSGEQYVGGTAEFHARWKKHLKQLREGSHFSRKLQTAWDRHGEEAFEFRILEWCEPGDIDQREAAWVWLLSPAFNTAEPRGDGSRPRRREFRGGEWIKLQRIRAGLSSKELSRMLEGKSASMVCNWECNRRAPSPQMYPRMAEIFGVSVDEVIRNLRPELS